MSRLVLFLVCCCISSVSTFELAHPAASPRTIVPARRTSSGSSPRMAAVPAHLVEPTERDSHYASSSSSSSSSRPLNVARYLVDLHDAKATFNFCGGMMFQLVLSDKLRDHLGKVAEEAGDDGRQPVIFDASNSRMFQIPDYDKTASADNVRVFHGREIRQVPDAEGGMGFVLQLSLADGNDPEGWTKAEIEGYDGWGQDSGRVWRQGDRLEEEGFDRFRSKFGPKSFGLHHRFYLHFDRDDRMWLSAEDGCEGTPARPNPLSKLFRLGL